MVFWNRLLGGAVFDSEENHRLARGDRGVRSTVIPINPRNHGRKWPKATYRRQMKNGISYWLVDKHDIPFSISGEAVV